MPVRLRAGGGGGGGGGPTVTLLETDRTSDVMAVAPEFPDGAQTSETLVLPVGLPVVVQAGDALSIPAAVLTPQDTVQTSDPFSAFILEFDQKRSGTPDSDAWGDGWTDQNSAGTNHGNVTPLSFNNATALTEHRAHLKFDMRRLSGLVAVPGATNTFRCTMTNADPVLAKVATLSFGAGATNPFTESTLAWTNQPATPTLFTKVPSLPANSANAIYTLTLTDSEVNSLLGKWVHVVFTTPTLTASAVSVNSREIAGAAYRWAMNLQKA